MLMTPLVIGAPPMNGVKTKPRQRRADDADHGVEDNALLTIGPHDHSRTPSSNAAADEKKDNTHIVLQVPGSDRGMPDRSSPGSTAQPPPRTIVHRAVDRRGAALLRLSSLD